MYISVSNILADISGDKSPDQLCTKFIRGIIFLQRFLQRFFTTYHLNAWQFINLGAFEFFNY